ncbi:EAL domain-containing protein [Nostoc sp. FACHB-892]|uniref:putative bifunctional diguanylate cyclase/phosphodiesterase n=1 Tax=Nostoc sp. FACHB-892 TaxID=2692843 RepID=UPI001689FD39|nr:EAL domain-containing protein [Nostoc sp. FACHB-892]MBD2732046.1 EAL domain-containing protein [Nostoc sp. FACHB-892]
MRTSAEIKAEIAKNFGFVPSFFEPAEQNVQALENLWQQTLCAYVNNPLSPMLKEKLFAYLSRYCALPYCIICHSCHLRTLGVEAQQILDLLESPPPTATDIDAYIHILACSPSQLINLSDLSEALERSLLYCSIFIFLEPEQGKDCRSHLRHLLGLVNYQHLITFISYIKMCHLWIEAHPEVSYKADKRVIKQLSKLLESEPSLADFFDNYIEKVRHQHQLQTEHLAQVAQRQQNQEALQKAYEQLEIRVEERTAELLKSNMLLKQEILERQQAQARLANIAFHDALTGLPNRMQFMERLKQTVERAKSYGNLFAVLFLDLDRFKVVNDSLGHTIGDQLLVALADRLQTGLRSGDILARLGGDEFAILLEEIQGIKDVIDIAERLQQQLAIPFHLSGHEVFSTVSIGIALSTTGDHQVENLLRNADIAMYRAKALGRAGYKIFDTAMYTERAKLLQLETDLRRAIERQEFRIYYQPIVSLQTEKIIGFESLIRWQHPKQGLVLPTDFISVAEETGLIVPIGYWVLREACNQMHQWQQQFPQTKLTISVNLSSKQLLQSNFTEQIYLILQETKLDASRLKLEMTESVLIENTQSVTAILWQLKRLGIELHVDDFGTGYSSLSYLHRFPINALKIDRSFIKNMDTSRKYAEIVRTIIALAHNLSIDVIAEGIETVVQLKQVKKLQCKYGQGYFFSQPAAVSVAGALIQQQSS